MPGRLRPFRGAGRWPRAGPGRPCPGAGARRRLEGPEAI